MSSPLAIAAVTATLKDLLNDGLLNHDLTPLGSFSVTALPPDRITTGATEPNQLNLFLYQITSNAGWRNVDLPSRDSSGARLTNPPLALDLHYLLTAYGSQDFNAEILLGYAMHLLHETPVLSRAQLRTVLGGTPLVDGTILPSPFGTLSANDLADQVELVKITPAFLSSEDLSKMWTAMQARYRPSMAYTASVVLIQAREATHVAPPVLTRGKDDRGPVATAAPPPALLRVRPAASELLPAIRLGDDVLLTGTNLGDATSIKATFAHASAKATLVRQLVTSANATPPGLRVHLPSPAEDAAAMGDWATGAYIVSLTASPNPAGWPTNGFTVALAPIITVAPANASPGDFTITVTCTPRLLPEQEPQTELILGSQTLAPDSIQAPADLSQPTTLTFKALAVPTGNHLVRLRVAGIQSLPIKAVGFPEKLEFDPQQRITVA